MKKHIRAYKRLYRHLNGSLWSMGLFSCEKWGSHSFNMRELHELQSDQLNPSCLHNLSRTLLLSTRFPKVGRPNGNTGKHRRRHLWWGSRTKMLLPQLPDAMLGIVSSLSLVENFAVRASSRGIEISISEGFLRLRKLEIQSPVVHSLGTLVPKCLQGLQHMILTQGISLVNGHLPDLAEELAAAAHFAVQLPRLQRVDLTRYECSLLFQSVGDQDVSVLPVLPVLPHCFLSNILFNAEARDCEGGQHTSRSFQFCLDEALIWCQLLKAAQGKRCSTAGQDWSTAVTSTRHAACAAVGPTARRFVAHALCSADGTEQLICDLRMLTKLEDLHLVGIPKGFVRIRKCRV